MEIGDAVDNDYMDGTQFEVDLETLLGISSQDLGVAGQDADVFVLNDVEDEVTEPHIALSTKKMEEVLRISAVLAGSGMGSLDSKCLCMDVLPGKVRFSLTDAFMIHVVQEVVVLNTENQFTGTVVFSTGVLARILRVCPSVFTLVRREEEGKKSYVIQIMGGEMPIDHINNANLAVYQKDMDGQVFTDYNKHELADNLKRMFVYANSAVRDERVLNFRGNILQATPHGSAAQCEVSERYPTFGMKVSVARLLHMLITGDSSDKVRISAHGNVYQGDGFSMMVSNVDSNVCVYESLINGMFKGEGSVVDLQHLARVTELSCGLDYSDGNLEFNFTEDGMVQCLMTTERKNSLIGLRGTPNALVKPLEHGVSVSALNVRSVLTVVSQESTVFMRISEDGISLEVGRVRVLVLGKGVGK